MPYGSLLIDALEEPLVIWNTLTSEAHGYLDVPSALAGRNEFEFEKMKPGIYGVKNYTMQVFPVLLFNRTYLVNPGTEWRFIAHDEISSHSAFLRDAAMARIIRSYWDMSLGGSLWDDDQSIWDGFVD
jgi:hypothetical protein